MPYKSREIEMEKLLEQVLERNASDLHIVVGKPPVLRIDGELVFLDDLGVLSREDAQELSSILLTDVQRERFLQEKEIDFSYAFKDNTRFRANVYLQKGYWGAALRLVPNRIKTLEELALPPVLKNFTNYTWGLVLMVGPTGHGKSTTLASLIDLINHTRSEHIVTIEDPIEFVYTQDKSIIDQREVYHDTNSFANALRSALREDVNVLLVGEMRDLESIAAALTLAETGHLVFATLHTNDAPQTVDRIIDVFPPHQQNQIRAQLSMVLQGVVSQRLLPRLGGGRVPAVEILFSNAAVRNVVREGRTHELLNIIHTGGAEGMQGLDQSLANLVLSGAVQLEDAQAYAHDEAMLNSLVQRR
jgi:twitching motility protein PilT